MTLSWPIRVNVWVMLAATVACLAQLSSAQDQEAPLGRHLQDVAYNKMQLQGAQEAKDREMELFDLIALAKSNLWPGEENDAINYFKKALTLSRELNEKRSEAQALAGMGDAYFRLGQKQLALKTLNRALGMEQAIGYASARGETLRKIGDVYDSMGMKARANAYRARAEKFPVEEESVPLAEAEAPASQASAPELPPPPTAAEEPPTSAAEPPASVDFPTAAAPPPPSSSSAEPPDSTAAQRQAEEAERARQLAALKEAQEQAKRQARRMRLTEERNLAASGTDQNQRLEELLRGTESANAGSTSAPPPLERYPNIEAPDSVTAGQEIAVQISLTQEQIAPETKIVAGAQKSGRLQLSMLAREKQWKMTVNLTAPGMEITRGGTNTQEMTITRDGDSTIAVFYLRAQPLTADRKDSRILATLWHDGAFIARLSRPLTIVPGGQAAASRRDESGAPVTESSNLPRASAPIAMETQAPAAPTANAEATSKPAPPAMMRVATTRVQDQPALRLDPAIVAPDLTIIENRIGNMLRLTLYSARTAPVEADIPDADDLHNWINAHFAQMASRGRGLTTENAPEETAQAHASDYLDAFGAELYDRFAPQAFKDLFFRLWPSGTAQNGSIQVFSDDPSLPWELMRPGLTNGTRGDFLGAQFSIARWPLSRRGMTRPPQSVAVEQSVVIAPGYRGAQALTAASDELTTLKNKLGFSQVTGNYVSVRTLAGHPPQGIVHFAGHGEVLTQNGVPQFEIVLEDGDIDPGTWESLAGASSGSHPLFFFNACDVGSSQQFMNDVDGWAPALLGNGASGYIGALWPVKDSTAAQFATMFYEQMGKSLAAGAKPNVAALIMQTRAEVFRQSHDATALAYVFYGDPKLVLTSPGKP